MLTIHIPQVLYCRCGNIHISTSPPESSNPLWWHSDELNRVTLSSPQQVLMNKSHRNVNPREFRIQGIIRTGDTILSLFSWENVKLKATDQHQFINHSHMWASAPAFLQFLVIWCLFALLWVGWDVNLTYFCLYRYIFSYHFVVFPPKLYFDCSSIRIKHCSFPIKVQIYGHQFYKHCPGRTLSQHEEY